MIFMSIRDHMFSTFTPMRYFTQHVHNHSTDLGCPAVTSPNNSTMTQFITFLGHELIPLWIIGKFSDAAINFTGFLPQMINSRWTLESDQGDGWTRVQVGLDVVASVKSKIQVAGQSHPSSCLPCCCWVVLLPLGAQVVCPPHGAA